MLGPSRLGRTGFLTAATAVAIAVVSCVAAPTAGAAGLPTVTKISPERGPAAGGATVTIHGTNLEGATEVHFGPRAATHVTPVSAEEVTATAPPWTEGNAIAEVTVTTPGGTSAIDLSDSYFYEPAVTKVEPSSGSSGTTVTITGQALKGNFENGAGEMPPFVKAVKFGSVAATGVTDESASTITAVAPAGVGTLDVTVETLAGTSATLPADEFSYGAQPSLFANNVKIPSNQRTQFAAWGELKIGGEVLGTLHCMDVFNGTLSNATLVDDGTHGVGQLEGLTTAKCKDPAIEEMLEPIFLCVKAGECGQLPEHASVYMTAEMPARSETREGVTCREPGKKLTECEAESEREVRQVITTVRRRAESFPWKLQITKTESEEEEVPAARLGGETADCYPTTTAVVAGKEVQVPASYVNVPAGCIKINVVVPQIPVERVYYGRLEPSVINGVHNGLSPSRLDFAESGKLVNSGLDDGSEVATAANEATVSGELKVAGFKVELLTAK